jgi:hypothetical protein
VDVPVGPSVGGAFKRFQFSVELDRNKPEIRMKALVSSAFGAASNLDSIAATVAHKTIAGGRYGPISDQPTLANIVMERLF